MKCLALLWLALCAIAIVIFFPDPSGAHYLAAGFILLSGLPLFRSGLINT